ncbi:MAG: GAF domain-containing protein [Anaerolineae bacterium]|nr:GAF domain-containing protein [Anaerolineae bacterium]
MNKQLTSASIWSVLDNLTEGVIIAEANGAIAYVNQAAISACSIMGLDNDILQMDNLFADAQDWHGLMEAPATVVLQVNDGRSYLFQSQPYQNYIQITFSPAHDAETTAVIEQLVTLTNISSEPNFDEKLQLIVDGLQDTGWQRVLLTLRDENFNATQIISAGFSEPELQQIANNALTAEKWLALLDDPQFKQYQKGSCYFVPEESNWAIENLGDAVPARNDINKSSRSWHPYDFFVIPLLNREQKRIGLIGLDEPTNGRRPEANTFQTIELYAQFAASIIENAQLVDETLARSADLENIVQASHALSAVLEEDMILSTVAVHMSNAARAEGFRIYRWKPEQKALILIEEDVVGAKMSEITAVTPNNQLLQILNQGLVYTTQHTTQEPPLLPTPKWEDEDQTYATTLVPILVSDELVALVQILYRRQQPLNQRETQLLTALANQASSALETALIFSETYEREQFYNALGSVSMAINFTLEQATVLNLICSESLRIFEVDGAYIWHIENDVFIGSAAKGFGEEGFVGTAVPITDTNAFVASIANTGQATYINHLNQKENISLRLPNREAIQSVLGVPLEQEGNIIGVLILVDTNKPVRFSDKHITWATMFGVQATIALRNAKLFEELHRFNEELDLRVAERTRALHEESNRVKILLRITSELSESLDQDHVLNQALHLVNEVVNATQGVILLINQENNQFTFQAAFGLDRAIPRQGVPTGMSTKEGLAGWMIDNRSAVIVDDTEKDPRWVIRPSSQNHRSVLGVPLISNEEVIGVMMLFHLEPGAFTMQQLDLVEAAAIQVANAINNANLYRLIRDQAERLGRLLYAEQIETAKSQAILESIADGVLFADNQSEIILANLPASAILDIPRKQLVGKSVNELLGLYGHSGDSWINTIEDWAQNADRIKEWTYLADQLTIEDKVVSVHLSPVLASNQFFGTVSIFRDITKEVEVDKLKSEFVSTVSHELRTPMTSIKGYADLMLMGAAGTMSPPQQRYLKVIKNNADRLHMLVNDLLNISRIETGKTTLDLRPLDVPQIIEQVVVGHLQGRIQHENKKLNVKTDIESSLPLVNADHARITQILTNLIDNAFNYTPENGLICLSVKSNGEYVFVSVQDSGIGISEENQQKIFERFFRAEDEHVQAVPGTGLGLAIVRSLIEMHGGQLKVDSKLGEGSTFTFNLPVVIEDSDPT